MGEGLLHWLESHGYAGLAIGVFLESTGVPIPGETALLVAAFAAAKGSLSLPYVILVAAGAGILGDNLGYLLGRRLGRGWLQAHGHRFFLPPDRLAQMDRFFDRFGAAAVAAARFVTGVRVVAAFSAGVSRLRWPVFLAFNILGAAAWAAVIGILGYLAGRGTSALGVRPWMIGVLIVGAVVVLVAAANLRRRLGEPLTRWVKESWLGSLLWWEVWVLLLSVSGLMLFAKIAEDVVQAESGPFDAAIRYWMLAHQWAPATHLFSAVGWLGSALVAVPLTIVIASWLWFRSRRTVAGLMLLSALIGSALVLGLKLVFHRGYLSGTVAALPAYSFPSSHATTITAIAVTGAYVLGRQRVLSAGRAVVLALSLIACVGISRVYLDLSWATDVIGGWAVGLFVAAVAVTFFERLGGDWLGRSAHRARTPVTRWGG